jgi:amino acid adenylation domain-containing protein
MINSHGMTAGAEGEDPKRKRPEFAGPNETDRRREAISDAERRNLVFERNQTQAEYPRDACFHSLFEAQVERSPDSLAVESAGSWLSYRELNVRSNQFAHRLRSLGVGPESLVGIFVDPSVDTLVGVLAILKAGGAYVPLDPAYPKERIAFMREDAALKVVLTQEHLVQELPPGIEHVVCLDVVASKPIEESAQNPVSGVSAENLAYIIYTSGSTGRPKGVMIHHRGLVNYLMWAVAAYDVASGSGALVHSSLSFDLTITGLFAPLLVGRGVTIVAAQHDISALSRTLRKRKDASLVKITPAHLELLRRQLSAGEMAGRTRAFVIGGEALLGESVAFWQEHSPDTVLVNEYGPTETVVGCCVYFVPQECRFAGAVPIGRPIANTQLYVLDADLQPVSAGETGELYIAGDGVARGYLNLPDVTARSFVANPFYAPGAATSTRMYKTGDLVRYLPDGNLDFLGRADQQVKIRGFRIEVGEIEAVLASHRNVRGSVVLALPDALGEKALTAYIEPVLPIASTAAELRQFLKERLPDYMVPARYVMLPAFPLTPNGKVDRQALPPPDAATSASGVAFVAPRNELERKLADIWEEVLPGASVGLDDNFFDVGGHSLLAVHLVNEINRWFSAKLDVLTLYQEPTVRALARKLEGDSHVAVGAKLVQVRTGKGGSPVFFLNASLEFFGSASRIERDEPIWISDVPWSTDLLQASARGETATFPTLAAMAAPHTKLILQAGRRTRVFSLVIPTAGRWPSKLRTSCCRPAHPSTPSCCSIPISRSRRPDALPTGLGARPASCAKMPSVILWRRPGAFLWQRPGAFGSRRKPLTTPARSLPCRPQERICRSKMCPGRSSIESGGTRFDDTRRARCPVGACCSGPRNASIPRSRTTTGAWVGRDISAVDWKSCRYPVITGRCGRNRMPSRCERRGKPY